MPDAVPFVWWGRLPKLSEALDVQIRGAVRRIHFKTALELSLSAVPIARPVSRETFLKLGGKFGQRRGKSVRPAEEFVYSDGFALASHGYQVELAGLDLLASKAESFLCDND